MTKSKLLLVLLVLIALGSYFTLDLGQYLSLQYAQSRLAEIQAYRDNHFVFSACLYFAVYVIATALSIPGAIIITLVGGAIFGLFWGTLLVSFASSIGATLAFLVSRLILRDWVEKRFGDYLAPINRGIERDGNFYLFSIRMVPLFPFFIVNLLMGLTSIRTFSYYWVSQLGMLLGTIVYVNAGSELAQIESVSGLVSAPVLFSLVLLGVLPLVARFLLGLLRRSKPPQRHPQPAHFDANVVVIGAGSAGLVASLIVAGAKAKVVLIEKHKMGGDCLNTGCVPSKSLIRSGRIKSYLDRAQEFGIADVKGTVDFGAVMQRVRDVIARIEPHDSVARFTGLGVECIAGDAHIESPYCVTVDGRRIHTRSIILASGARPQVPPIPGLDSIDYYTSDTIWTLESLPPRLLVVGGGPIGCELAQAFSNLGSRVTQVDMAPRLLPREDPEVADLIAARFAAQGIHVLTGHSLQRFIREGDVGVMVADYNGSSVRVEFDAVLLAVGRKANVEGFGLEALGVATTAQGTVAVNEFMQTNYPNIYACGDVAGPYQFTHMASYQAWFAALNAMLGGLWRSPANYRVVPWATFTDPEIARVGLNETEAREQGIPFELTRYDLDDLDRAIADSEAHGFIKILTPPGSDRILGVTIVGYHAAELIGEFVLAMTHNLGLKKISAATHIYPTLYEANKFAANTWRNARLPQRYFPWLERFFRWRRNQE